MTYLIRARALPQVLKYVCDLVAKRHDYMYRTMCRGTSCSRMEHDQLVAGAPNAKVALLHLQNIKNIKVKKRTCLRQITGRAVNRNRPMHRRKKSLAMYSKKSEAI